MQITRRNFVQTASVAGLIASAKVADLRGDPPDTLWKLWYSQPAKRWLDALPVGNGRLGAVVFGGIEHEVLGLNESTMWSGSQNQSSVNPATRTYLAEMRRLLFEGHYAEGNALCAKYLSGREDSYGTHLPLARLHLDASNTCSDEASGYTRWLDLKNGIACVDYVCGGAQIKREIFASNPDRVLVMRISANQPGKLSLSISLDAGDLTGESQCIDERTLVLFGSAWEKRHSDGKIGVDAQTWVQVITEGGRVSQGDQKLLVEQADSVTIFVAANTTYGGADFGGLCASQIKAAADRSYASLRARMLRTIGDCMRA